MAERRLVRAVSIGFAFLLGYAFLWFNADAFSPLDPGLYRSLIGVYAVGLALVLAFESRSAAKTERPLFNAAFLSWQGLGRFAISAVASLFVLVLLGLLIKGESLPSIYEAVSRIGVGLALFHALIVGFSEELIFRGFVTNELRANRVSNRTVYISQAVLFALFHFYSSGGQWIVMAMYIPLGLAFLYIRDKFSPATQMANTGAHFAWNMFILGFVRGVTGM